jgi:hypothetical protein
MKGHYNEPLGVYSPHALYMYIESAAMQLFFMQSSGSTFKTMPMSVLDIIG